MAVIYVTTQGACVQRRSGQLVVCKQAEVLQNVPETHVEQIVLFGNAHLTTPVVAFCLERAVDVAYLSVMGNFRGRLHGDLHKVAQLRQSQYAKAFDAQFQVQQARAIVGGKLDSLIAFARRQHANAARPTVASETVKSRIVKSVSVDSAGVESADIGGKDFALLQRLRRSVKSAASVETLLGLEGAASAAYFRMFAGWLPAGWTFAKRTAHPPQDATNALMSLSYTLLYNRIVGLCNVVGLDPYVGCFHLPHHGHAALASDMLEEFRAGFCDALVLKVLRRGQIKPSDIVAKKSEFRLHDAALKIFLTEFETRLNTRRHNPLHKDMSLTYRQIIERQIRDFARVVKGELAEYRPFIIR